MTKKLLHEYMDEAIREGEEKARMDRVYNKLILKNKIRFCEASYSAITYPTSTIRESRQRMTKEIAQELVEQHGPMAALHCLEKLANDTLHPQMWRDVMSWIIELQGEKNDNDDL